MKQSACVFLILSLLLMGCVAMPVSTAAATVSSTTAATASPTLLPPPTVPPPAPNLTPTPDLRLPPDQWQNWPIVPQVSARALQIYQYGLRLGNDPHHFSKIGDCQSIPASFLGIYDTDRYTFAPEYQPLQETVDFYKGSFSREGESVRGGFNTSSVLLPLWANAEVCQPGENPIECENRLHNPSIVFISLEVWFEGRTPDVYEGYLRRIIEYNLAQGTLPILATKADNVEGDHSINATIARLAYEYDLPLWNFWRAVQPLPNHGLDPNDPTGFHLNLDGWNTRSFTALQTLDAIHRATAHLTADGTPPAPPVVSTAAPAASFTPGPVTGLPFSRVIPASAESVSARLLLGFSTRTGETLTSAGIFQGDLNGQAWTALAAPGWTLLDASSAGLLAAQGQNLYFIQDAAPSLLTDQLAASGQPAIFLPDGRIAVILQTESGDQLALFHEDKSQIVPTEAAPQTLHPSRDPNHLYWSAAEKIFVTDLGDLSSHGLAYTGRPAFAADGKMAFLTRGAEGGNQLLLVNGEATQTLPLFGNRLVDMQWSPDGATLAISVANVSEYSGRVLAARLYFVTWPYRVDEVWNVTDRTIEQQVWSPDGKSMLLVTRHTSGADYLLQFSVLDVATQTQVPALGFAWRSANYNLLQPIVWMP